MRSYLVNHLAQLEAEAIYVLRETAAQFQRPVLLFSGGKDSIVMTWLARKAFWPARLPFPLVHIDTGHNFPETLEFRDRFVKDMEADLQIGLVEESIRQGKAIEETGPAASRNKLQTVTLLDTLAALGADAALGGGRRDEEKARAKERFFSHRNQFGEWDPKNQRPELWHIYNCRIAPGESIRVFPLSNWTELDVWRYIEHQAIPVVPLYFAARRPVVERAGALIAVDDERFPLEPDERPRLRLVRFRTLGCYPLTAAVESNATTVADIIREVAAVQTSERAGRLIDHDRNDSMEKKKREGYF
jgi:sulfate adenylyltransferase subunit 2